MHGKQRFKVTAESQRGIVGTVERMTIQRMDHVGIVVDDLAAATAFFVELGLKLQGEGSVEGGWVDRVVGLEGVRSEIAMLETPDGHGRLELSKFHAPSGRGGDRHAPANTPGIRHLTFAVDDIDAAVASVRARGGELVGEVENYEDIYRLCYVRGPEGIIVELAERIGDSQGSEGSDSSLQAREGDLSSPGSRELGAKSGARSKRKRRWR